MKGFNQLLAGVLAGHGSTQNLVGKPVMAAAQGATPGVGPTAPGPGDVFKEGTKCTFSWTPDPAGLWKKTNVELMSGDNWNMVHLTTVATFDGTDASKTSFSYPCPDVAPNSAIYFYQFSSPAAPKQLAWTTRFTIAGADGATTTPANDTQPDGQKIPWGVGALKDPSKAVAAPSYLGGATPSSSASDSSSSSSTASGSSSSSTVSGSSSSSTVSDSSATTAAGAAGLTPTTQASDVTQVTTQKSTDSAASASGTAGATGGNNNGALSAQTNLAVGAVAMVVTAFVFGVMS